MISKLRLLQNHFHSLSPILTLVFLLLWLRSCQEEAQQIQRHENNLRAKEKEIRSYRLSNGQLAQEKGLLTLTREELKARIRMKDDSLHLLLKKLKDPLLSLKWKTRYVYDTVYMAFDTPVSTEFVRNFSKTTEWYSLSGTVNQSGIHIDSLTIPNTQRLVVGYQKGNPVVKVSNSNPHLVSEALEGQIIKLPSRPWVFGLGGTWNLYEPPSAGFFLGYRIFEF